MGRSMREKCEWVYWKKRDKSFVEGACRFAVCCAAAENLLSSVSSPSFIVSVLYNLSALPDFEHWMAENLASSCLEGDIGRGFFLIHCIFFPPFFFCPCWKHSNCVYLAPLAAQPSEMQPAPAPSPALSSNLLRKHSAARAERTAENSWGWSTMWKKDSANVALLLLSTSLSRHKQSSCNWRWTELQRRRIPASRQVFFYYRQQFPRRQANISLPQQLGCPAAELGLSWCFLAVVTAVFDRNTLVIR